MTDVARFPSRRKLRSKIKEFKYIFSLSKVTSSLSLLGEAENHVIFIYSSLASSASGFSKVFFLSLTKFS